MKNSEIKNLIECPKDISEKPNKQPIIRKGSEHYNFRLTSTDKEHNFRVFVRKNIEFPDNFSIGLQYLAPAGDDIILLRLNGAHGLHQNKVVDAQTYDGFHIHQATEEAISQNMRSEEWAYETKEYLTLEKALAVFWKMTKINDRIDDYFILATQQKLF